MGIKVVMISLANMVYVMVMKVCSPDGQYQSSLSVGVFI
jgi:hypothetical protein